MNVKKLFLLGILCLYCFSSIGQTDFSKIDQYARETPSSKTQSIEKLAAYLTKPQSERESVRAIYVWMAENIKYNHRVINNNRISIEQRLKKEKAERVLKAKWAVCEGYSNLFQALCSAGGIACEIVTGIVKDQNGDIPAIGHAWNIVRVDGQWLPVDVTWGAGGLSDENDKFVKDFKEDYFLSDPIIFVQNHLPHDPLFQLLENPINSEDFKKGNQQVQLESTSQTPVFPNIKDSLNYYSPSKAE